MNTNTPTPRTDDEEAKYRAAWLHANNAPYDWVVLTIEEVRTLRADLARVTAERNENKRSIEAYLNERVCCTGEACGCGGATRLQQIVHEEAGSTIDRLADESATLRARVADLQQQLDNLTASVNTNGK